MTVRELAKLPTGLFVDGGWRPSIGEQVLPVEDPSTGRELVSVASATPTDALHAVDAAERAAGAWAACAPRERSEILRRAFDLMLERSAELAVVISGESGKALAESRAEVRYAAEFLRWYAEEAVRVLGEVGTAPSGTNRMLVTRHPVGIAVFVTPWNFPAAMVTRKLAPALAAGCTSVLKPAPETPLTALVLADLLAEAGVPAGVVNVLPTADAAGVVETLLADRRVRALSFTGSTAVGRLLLAKAARNVLRCSMELGGNAPFIVLEDADLSLAVDNALIAKLRNGGQSCTAANRFLVHERVADEFARRLADRMSGTVMGSGTDPGVELGPLISAAARAKVAELVEDALARGARCLTGGRTPDGAGYFYPPTVLVDVPPDARIVREEVFGPVAPIVRFKTADEAVRVANDTDFGLVSYLHTRDLGRALAVTEQLEAGMVGVNRGMVSDPAAPFGGWKHSGLGREGGRDGILEYLETKYTAIEW
ncbi:NAD-dependent succinate-semialdehyde dehydrogenase [Dactylosporangium roseum]|uniref:NAD-dependent succinate-semialdehyde dehydrogenase n=1 Tax=Dactylosporangium roseum TaxID=47989 RepID=A0ABY5ZAW6_9ACTN|nr:NAD-dependent succinate-semialdehyde dehydrogenase [Dactylosporangium roseum]UWZ39230.1 NAD-dependent succinate-semialdehyde dehydrogenase [Dactylosporangium roseum]